MLTLRKTWINSICFLLILNGFSCTKEKEEDKIVTPFYQRTRTVLLHESFENGLYSKAFDSISYQLVKGFVYVQNGTFSENQDGYFTIGSPPPLNVSDTIDSLKTYALDFLDTLFDFRTFFPFQASSAKLGIEITYNLKGKTEFYYMDRTVIIEKDQIPSNETVLNVSLGDDFVVYMDDINVTGAISSTIVQSSASRIEFFVRNEVVEINGQRHVNYYGMRIKEIEIYLF